MGCGLCCIVGCGREQPKTEEAAILTESEGAPDPTAPERAAGQAEIYGTGGIKSVSNKTHRTNAEIDDLLFASKFRIFGYLAVKYGIEQGVMEKLASDYLMKRDYQYWVHRTPDGPGVPKETSGKARVRHITMLHGSLKDFSTGERHKKQVGTFKEIVSDTIGNACCGSGQMCSRAQSKIRNSAPC